MFIWLFLALTCLLGFISFGVYITTVRRRFSHFYCPKYNNFLLAHLKEIIKSKLPLRSIFLQWSEESGDNVFVLFSSWRVHLHVIDTDKIKKILGSSSIRKAHNNITAKFCGIEILGTTTLLTETGSQAWVDKRKVFDPLFHANGLRKCHLHISEVAKDMVDIIDVNNTTNITELMGRHISLVIAKVVMEITDQQGFQSYTNKITNIFAGLAVKSRNKNTFWLPWKYGELKKSVTKDLVEVRSYFKNYILNRNFDEIDLSSSLGAFIKTNVQDGQLKVDEVINDMVMFFFAGIDTSMHTINFAFYEMLQNPQMFYKLEKELLRVLGTGDSSIISYEDVKDLKYLDKFIKEVLRYHPIVSTVTRTSGKGFDLCGVHVPGNTTVHVNIECVQNCERYWDDPLRFSVDRWEAPPAPFSYIPFSGGTRGCIGKHLALLEIKVFIVSILHKYTIDFENSDIREIGTSQFLTNRLSEELYLKFRARTDHTDSY